MSTQPRTRQHRAGDRRSRASGSAWTSTAPARPTISTGVGLLRPHADRAGQALADRPRGRAAPATCTSTPTTPSRTPRSCSARRSGPRSATRRGIRRFGDALVPLDEALAQAVVDVSGRPYCVHSGEPAGPGVRADRRRHRRRRALPRLADPARAGDAGVPRPPVPARHACSPAATRTTSWSAQFKAVARALRDAVAPRPAGGGRAQHQGRAVTRRHPSRASSSTTARATSARPSGRSPGPGPR